MIRRVGDPIKPGIRYRPRPGAYAILPTDDGILLTLRDIDGPELQLPGGGIDAGESPIQALHREVFEETGWRIAAPRRLGAYRRFVYMPEYDLWADKLCIIYLARPVRRLGPAVEDGHRPLIADWATATTSVTSSGDRLFLRKFLSGAWQAYG